MTFLPVGRGLTPGAIATGLDGALWFASGETGSSGRVAPSGAVRIFHAPGMKWPAAIATGRDGALWFANFSGRSIGRITVDGAVRTYTAPGVDEPFNVAAAPDGTIWFTDSNGSIGRVGPNGTV